MASFKWTVDPIPMPVFRRSGGPSTARPGAAQSVTKPEDARAAGVREIERLIAQGAKDAALHKTVEVYGISLEASRSYRYDPHEHGYGHTAPNGEVTIGGDAFRSVPWLAASLEHEMFHTRQYKEGRGYESRIGEYMNEVEVRDHVIAQAARFGLSEAETQEQVAKRQELWDRLPREYQSRVARGDYTLKLGEDKRLPGWEDKPPKEEP